MKFELIRKVMVVGGVMLIGIAICVSVWFLLREHKERQLQRQSRLIHPNNKIAADNHLSLPPSQKPARNTEEELLTRKERVTRQASSMFMSTSLSKEQLATPFAQKMLEAMDSPEFFNLLRSDFTERQWNDFMESQGVPVIRGHPGIFRKVVPDMELADYEPVVRQNLAELFIATKPVDLANPVAAALQRSTVYLELAKTDMAAVAWFMEKFGEDKDGAFRWESVESNPAFIWMTDVQRNAASIVADAKTVDVPVVEASASTSVWTLPDTIDSSLDTTPSNETEVPTKPDTSELTTIADKEIDTVIEKSLTPQLSETLTNSFSKMSGEIQSNLETTLREQFSLERFERAMSTLERYGPEEGLRRLRENDPEVAKQIENSRQHNRKEVSQ